MKTNANQTCQEHGLYKLWWGTWLSIKSLKWQVCGNGMCMVYRAVNSEVRGWEGQGVCVCWGSSWLSWRNRVKLGRKRGCETTSTLCTLLKPAWRADLAWPTAPKNLLSRLMTTHTQARTHTDAARAFTQMKANKKSKTSRQKPQNNQWALFLSETSLHSPKVTFILF